MADEYDVLILGAGNAGLAAATAARAAGQRVLVVERREVGGVCPLRGCVPKKVLVAAAQALDVISRAGTHRIALSGPPELDWPALVARARSFVEGVPEKIEHSLAARDIDVVHGRARFTGRHGIEVAGRHFLGRKIVVATGSIPRPLAIPGAEMLKTSDDLLELSALPRSIVFVGAGVIALELAHVLARAGTHVTLLETASRVLPFVDPDAAGWLMAATRELGVRIETSVTIDCIEKRRDGAVVGFRKGGERAAVTSQLVANGAGRVADLCGLELTAAGVTLEDGHVELDGFLRSVENPDVFFAGDAVPGRPQLSPLATYEGRIVGHNLTYDELRSARYGFQPAAVHTVPTLATVGLREDEASQAGLGYVAKTHDMREWRSARTAGEDVAWAKVLVEDSSDRILGAHLVGHGAEETIHAFALAIEKGFPAKEMASRVYAYPTFHSDLSHLV